MISQESYFFCRIQRDPLCRQCYISNFWIVKKKLIKDQFCANPWDESLTLAKAVALILKCQKGMGELK